MLFLETIVIIKREKVLQVVQNVRLILYTEIKIISILVSIRKDLKRPWGEPIPEIFEEGMSAGFLGDYEEAIEHFDKIDYLVVGLTEISKNALLYKAVALGKLGKHGEAIKVYKKLLELEKDDADVLYNIGVEYSELERYEEAIEYYDKSIEYDAEQKEAWGNKAGDLCELERYEEAIKCANISLEKDSNYTNALKSKSNSLVELERYEEAIKVSQKIIELEPEDYANWKVLGIQYLLINNLEKSLASFEKSQKYDLTDGITWFNKACVLSRLDKKEEALDSLFIAISIEPESLIGLRDEKDFKNIQNTERFQKMLNLPV